MPLANIETNTTSRRRVVLVVDSNPRNVRFLTTLLTWFEYDTHAVGTTQEALTAAADIDPVMIVAARQLGDGNDALGLIGSLQSAETACKAPFVVLCAKSDPAFERDCLIAGALTCLHAPITFENFYRVVQMSIEPMPRMTIRISVDVPAAINGKRADENVREISEGGAYIQTVSLHPRDTKLQVWIKLPDGVVSADAVVIYALGPGKGRKGGSGMGVQFAQISPEHQQRIRLFIRKEMSKDMEAGNK